MTKEEIFMKLEKCNLDKEKIIIISGASLVVQEIIETTSDIDLSCDKEYYEKINWPIKKGTFNLPIKYNGVYEISNNLYYPDDVIIINGYKFLNLNKCLEIKKQLNRLKDKDIIKKLENELKKEVTMKKIVFATGNPSKAKRFSKGLLKNDIEVLSLKDLDITLEVEENGKDAIENALIKARACYKKTNMPSIGMDDTLYLEGVPEEKQPGLFVRRVDGKTLNDEEMIKHYINIVKQYGENGKLNCKWIYGLAVIDKNGNEHTYTWKKDNFYMVDKQSDIINPGYPLNSISKYKNIDKYFTEITKDELELIKVNEDDVVEFIKNHI